MVPRFLLDGLKGGARDRLAAQQSPAIQTGCSLPSQCSTGKQAGPRVDRRLTTQPMSRKAQGH